MVKNIMNFITGRNLKMEQGTIQDINTMTMELNKANLERELSNIADRMIRRI
ncbi:hypothetical protein [Proteiniclasticum sp. QWL-01]|jgi:hypothetical protein|uniref:hypothetical protein n=1 Tax=Proteiniclasticum sp. QWL-01 TaxID=3036945 RepID=UPI00220CE901|nr:hypothetical protein [Proteiniclasticum sp. QWL-01]UUM12485.1 hypothetical protein NQU17_02665 [Clostridiaceae bacterium HFYG-1003]WFF74052.1 hypothetical protein P6M73_06270 [Proteiniclasticum sp. QWL-01]